jgi:FkbM family methyltransferase
MSLDALFWKARVLRTRLVVSSRYLWRVPLTYRNWPYALASKHVRKPGILELRNGCRFEVRPRTTDRAMINEIFIGKSYSQGDSFRIADYDRVLDIGANIGAFAIYAANRAKRGYVCAVEPVSANFSTLERNVKLNQLENVRLVRAAVGGRNGRVKIASAGAVSSVIWINENVPTEEVEQVTLESLVSAMGTVDLMKMDCEGAEFDILLQTEPSVLRKIRRIAMECHNVSKERTSVTLKNYLDAAGFETTVIGADWTSMIYALNRNPQMK